MGVAPEDPLRDVATRVGRVWRFLRERLVEHLRRRRRLLRGPAPRSHDCEETSKQEHRGNRHLTSCGHSVLPHDSRTVSEPSESNGESEQQASHSCIIHEPPVPVVDAQVPVTRDTTSTTTEFLSTNANNLPRRPATPAPRRILRRTRRRGPRGGDPSPGEPRHFGVTPATIPGCRWRSSGLRCSRISRLRHWCPGPVFRSMCAANGALPQPMQ